MVIGGEVSVAWKRKMLYDVIGRHQAYIQRKIYLFMKPRILQLAKTTREARDKIIKSLRLAPSAELRSE